MRFYPTPVKRANMNTENFAVPLINTAIALQAAALFIATAVMLLP
jgi:hypothetical protein